MARVEKITKFSLSKNKNKTKQTKQAMNLLLSQKKVDIILLFFCTDVSGLNFLLQGIGMN